MTPDVKIRSAQHRAQTAYRTEDKLYDNFPNWVESNLEMIELLILAARNHQSEFPDENCAKWYTYGINCVEGVAHHNLKRAMLSFKELL